MTGGMMFKGTPGPWRWAKRKSGYYDALEGNGEAVFHVDEYAGAAWLEVSDENANLIAAAPDLLEALMLGYEGIMQYDGQKKLKEIMRAAIAKALGEQK